MFGFNNGVKVIQVKVVPEAFDGRFPYRKVILNHTGDAYKFVRSISGGIEWYAWLSNYEDGTLISSLYLYLIITQFLKSLNKFIYGDKLGDEANSSPRKCFQFRGIDIWGGGKFGGHQRELYSKTIFIGFNPPVFTLVKRSIIFFLRYGIVAPKQKRFAV